MNTDDFFLEISKPVDGAQADQLIEKLFKLAKAINEMGPEDLIALFQALSLLKKQQPISFFGRNKIRRSIGDTQKIIITAMQQHPNYARKFNNVIGDDSVNGYFYHIN